MKLTVGPVAYYWPRAEMNAFYRDIADSEVDRVYLGETVCSKRSELNAADYLTLAQEFREAGKEVVLSTLTLLEAPGELKALRRFCEQREFLVEANDMAAVQFLSEQRLPFVVGSAINCYNPSTFVQLVNLGMVGWNIPVELSRDWLAALLADPVARAKRKETWVEVLGFGYLPLAYSARCFTARSVDRSKDDCRLVCLNYPGGRKVRSQDGSEVFTLNGIQTQSGQRYNLINDLAGMHGLVDAIRLCPEPDQTLNWITAFHDALNASPSETQYRRLPETDVNGYWHKLEGMRHVNE
ncbi:MAG: U32 family peptidase [Saccharospirillum sp.]|nr:U32 family peptidase [Saccharospirillum sp.]